jgi:ABC-type Fe3+/spermidine/putrescine transport system ATPase subunit
MSVSWGNPKAHTEAFVKALEEFHRQHPEERRPFQDLEREQQRVILARQVELYRETVHA